MEEKEMNGVIPRAAIQGSPTLLIVGGLLALGAVLTALGEAGIGWTIYGVGYVGALAAVALIVGLTRRSLGLFGWAGVAAVSAGIVIGLPKLVMVWGLYTGTPAIHDLFMPYAALPIVAVAGVVAWTGVLLFGVAGIVGGTLPKGAASLLIGAAMVALPFELRIAPQIFWVAASVMLFGGLAWISVDAAGARTASRAVDRP